MNINWMEETTEQLVQGAFLMVKGNPMTIGWCEFGRLWGKQCCTVFVRNSRYTHELLNESSAFTVSVPKKGTLRKELAYCGSHSGRDVNKCEALSLPLLPAHCGGEDGLAGCALHIECRILFRNDMPLSLLEDEDIRVRYYTDGDIHTAYVGEILGVYEEADHAH